MKEPAPAEETASGMSLEETIFKLQNRVDQYRNVDAENQRLTAKFDALTGEIEGLKARLDKFRRFIAEE